MAPDGKQLSIEEPMSSSSAATPSSSQSAPMEQAQATNASTTKATATRIDSFRNNSSTAKHHRRSSSRGSNTRDGGSVPKQPKQQKQQKSRPVTPTSGVSSRRPKCQITRTMVLRSILIGSLLTAAAVCAALSYTVLKNAEMNTAVQTYNSVALSATLNAKAIVQRKFEASEVTAALASWTNPNASDWPMIDINGYMAITSKIAALAQSTTQATMTFVLPNQTVEFEEHIQSVYKKEGRPETAGVSDFGFGIWKPDPNKTYEDGRAHDTTGKNTWGGKDERLVVLSLHNVPASKSLLYNLYSEENRGIHVDSMNACANAHNDTESSPQCAVFTDMLELKIRPGPAGLLFQPVFPANDPTEFVGFATTSLHWEEALTGIVPDYVNGLTCVVSTDTASFTYEIRKGGAVELIGDGDLHDERFDDHAESVILTDIQTGASTSAVYVLTVYPTEAMFETFSTESPMAIALAFTGVIFLCTMLFFLYDLLMRHEAEQRKLILDVKRRFVRFISHEIRTPLNTVCVGLELLERELKKDTPKGENDEAAFPFTTEDIDFWHTVTMDVKENAAIAVSILNDMLNYDKLETKALELESEEVNAVSLIDQTVHQFQLQAIDREVDLTLTFHEPEKRKAHALDFSVRSTASAVNNDPIGPISDVENNNLCVVGDEVRLSQVFRNVISNALKFTPKDGRIEVSVTRVVNGLPSAEDMVVQGKIIKKERRRGSLVVRISDTGVGLSKDQLEMLFGEGVQFDANKLQHGGGSGLGLNIAKGIVELHHGTVHAASEGHGHGTTFVIELPLYEISSNDHLELEETSQTQNPTEVGSCDEAAPSLPEKRRILVVEDALSSRKMLIRLLERDGHICVGASNGKDAVEMIEQDMEASRLDMSLRKPGPENTMPSHVKFDTILMDYEMPFVNGPDATRHIRAHGYEGTIIGVTGNVLVEDVDHFKSCGANEVLAKPISMEKLREYWNKHP